MASDHKIHSFRNTLVIVCHCDNCFQLPLCCCCVMFFVLPHTVFYWFVVCTPFWKGHFQLSWCESSFGVFATWPSFFSPYLAEAWWCSRHSHEPYFRCLWYVGMVQMAERYCTFSLGRSNTLPGIDWLFVVFGSKVPKDAASHWIPDGFVPDHLFWDNGYEWSAIDGNHR